jgi:hypothetical protein
MGKINDDSLDVDEEDELRIEFELLEDTEEPNEENQRLLRNIGVTNIIIQILKYNVPETQKFNGDYIDLIKTCYLFLIRFCKHNPSNQLSLQEHIDFFAREIDSCTLAVFLLREIFRDNK